MLVKVFGGELKREGWLRWNTNWFLRDDPGGVTPAPRDDLVVEDFLEGEHYFEAEDWRDPRVRDEAEATFKAFNLVGLAMNPQTSAILKRVDAFLYIVLLDPSKVASWNDLRLYYKTIPGDQLGQMGIKLFNEMLAPGAPPAKNGPWWQFPFFNR